MLGRRVIFSCGFSVFCERDETIETFSVSCGTIRRDPEQFFVLLPIVHVFESHDPLTGEPGYLLQLSNGRYLFHLYSDGARRFTEYSLPPDAPDGKSVVFDYLTRLVIEGNSLSCHRFGDSAGSVLCDIPADSQFVCWTSRQALLISRTAPAAFVVSAKKVSEFPAGFAGDLVAACFFDDSRIVFSTSDRWVHLYSKSHEIQSIPLESVAIILDVADLDCYERTCLYVTEDRHLFAIHFSSRSVNLIADSVRDFCVFKVPFDNLVCLSEANQLSVARPPDSDEIHGTVRAVIDALDSRVVAGLSELSELRRRLTLREKLTANSDVVLPFMVSLFGTRPEPVEPPESDGFSSPTLWTENVRDLSFDIHCDMELPLSCDVVLSSKSCAFIGSCVTEPINPNAMGVAVAMAIEKMAAYEPFTVFLRTDSNLYFVGCVEFLAKDLMISRPAPRISETYFVSFPPHFRVTSGMFPEWEKVGNGLIVTIEAESCEAFEQRLVVAAAQFPDGAVFERKVKTQFEVQAGKELARFVQKFIAGIKLHSQTVVERKLLMGLKSSVAELLTCVIW